MRGLEHIGVKAMDRKDGNKLEQAIREIREGNITKYQNFPLFLACTELDNPIVPGTKTLDTVIVYEN